MSGAAASGRGALKSPGYVRIMPDMSRTEPGVLDALALLTRTADELVVHTARDTHHAWSDRVHGLVRRPSNGVSTTVETMHRGISAAVFGGVSLGFRAASIGLSSVAATGIGPRLEVGGRGRFVRTAVNGLIGDRLRDEGNSLAITMAIRLRGEDVPVDPAHLTAAFPAATGKVVVFLHGLSESESYWNVRRQELGSTYGERLAAEGWTPVFLRANTGLPVRENGVALSALIQGMVDAWPKDLDQLALVGHSMGGLIIRAGCVVGTDAHRPWTGLISDVVTLGTPHLGAPIAKMILRGSLALARLPELAAIGRVLDHRSVGVDDLCLGLDDDVAHLPEARYRLVSAAVGGENSPLGHIMGDLLVRIPSAQGESRLFPEAEVLHLTNAHHFTLLNNRTVADALVRWLGEPV